jgi:lipoprotein NlpD
MLLSLIACSSGTIPVVERTRKQMPASGLHKVHKGETLYSIAWSYGLDYKTLARANGIRSPYVIRDGQTLYLRGPSVRRKPPPAKAPKKSAPKATALRWTWPTSGKVVSRFGSGSAKKGINIKGRMGQSVRAAQSGVVVYAGDGIRGYGNLVIV